VTPLIALDVAILPPSDVTERAIEYSAALAAEGPALSDRSESNRSQGLRLGADHLPHITLTQQFVRQEELDAAFGRIDDVLAEQPPLRIRITGSGHSGHTLWLAAERSPELIDLHERLMESLRGLERPEGGPHAFFEGHGRVGDVIWVAGFRLKSSFGAFTPHITLGHGRKAPVVESFAFDATTIAACHLGRFCTCRRVLRAWELGR
jgi:2'-5' RNA ligase